MHWHEAMGQPSHSEFMMVAEEEMQAHPENGLWEVINRSLTYDTLLGVLW